MVETGTQPADSAYLAELTLATDRGEWERGMVFFQLAAVLQERGISVARRGAVKNLDDDPDDPDDRFGDDLDPIGGN